MKILTTGSSGYVGYIISKYFSEKGTEVIGLDISPNNSWKGNNKFKFYTCSITDRKRLEEIFSKEKPTHVIHLAYLMDPLHNVKREYEIDVIGSKNVIETANATKTVKQFVQYSSTSAYGAWPNNSLWIKEETPLRPRDYRYGINKKRVEEYYNSFNKRKDMKLVILRMCTAIGPLYHKKGGVVSLLANAPLLGKFAKKPCAVQFLHEEDLKSLMDLIMNDKKIEGTYNFAPDSHATAKQLAPNKIFLPIPLGIMRKIIGVLWLLRLSSIRPAAITISTHGIIANPEKLMKRYNYKFKYTTLSGFKETVKARKAKGTL
ncbi:MAG: NAD-dependent epimerase/dehydratase family protein [archaeon]